MFEYFFILTQTLSWTQARVNGGHVKKTRLATIANFFFPGAGYLILGVKRELALLWLAGVIALTVVEFGIRDSEPTLYAVMFAAVLVMNTAFAIDAYRAGKSIESGLTTA